MLGKWIWLPEETWQENERAFFKTTFTYERAEEALRLEVSASTRYIVYLNGRELGRGPIRSGRKEGFFDSYVLDGRVKPGENELVFRVWSYGWSTYQTLTAHGGLIFNVRQGEKIAAVSERGIPCRKDFGHFSYAPKRNVNLGFTDYYDARLEYECWEEAVEVEPVYQILKKRPVEHFTWEERRPKYLLEKRETSAGGQQISINTRKAFFGDRRDADETIFSGFLGCEFYCEETMEGRLTFPNRTWNGIIGDFRIDEACYPVTNAERDIALKLEKGKHFFLMQVSGKFDDLYCHMEWRFPGKIEFLEEDGESPFFVVGPTQRIIPVINGYERVYGGLDEYNRLEFHTEEHEKLFTASSLEELKSLTDKIVRIEEKYVFRDAYFLSLAMMEQVVKREAVTKKDGGITWNNETTIEILPPQKGEYQQLLVDFGDAYVGSFEFSIDAAAGTVMDVYCFENQVEGETDYTIGLNNGIRYICRDGWQEYKCMTRMGCRYALITFRNMKEKVQLLDFRLRHAHYASFRSSSFECDDYLINRIWDMCLHTHEMCLEDTFTDCPTYEQSFWIGDAQMTALINGYVFGDYELIRHNLMMAVTGTENTKLMNALTPTDWTTSIPMWMMNWVISVSQYLELTKDESIVKDLYPYMSETLKYYENFIQEDGGFLINAWNMVDWAAMDIHNHGVVAGQQAELSWCYQLAAEFAKTQGEMEDYERFLACRKKLIDYLDQKIWDADRQMYLDGYSPESGYAKTVSMQTHVLMYQYQAIKTEDKRRIVESYIKEPPASFLKAGSPFMLHYLYECQRQLGICSEIFEDIKKRWGEMLRYETTTCWEVFPGFYEVSRTRSYCQSWSASPMLFFQRDILGIERQAGGFDRISIRIPEDGFHWCRGSVPTPHGMVRIWWDRDRKICKIHAPESIEIDTESIKDYHLEILRLE